MNPERIVQIYVTYPRSLVSSSQISTFLLFANFMVLLVLVL